MILLKKSQSCLINNLIHLMRLIIISSPPSSSSSGRKWSMPLSMIRLRLRSRRKSRRPSPWICNLYKVTSLILMSISSRNKYRRGLILSSIPTLSSIFLTSTREPGFPGGPTIMELKRKWRCTPSSSILSSSATLGSSGSKKMTISSFLYSQVWDIKTKLFPIYPTDSWIIPKKTPEIRIPNIPTTQLPKFTSLRTSIQKNTRKSWDNKNKTVF